MKNKIKILMRILSIKSQQVSTKIQEKEMRNLIVKDRARLEERLKELAETKYNGKLSSGAMCYCPDAPKKESYICPVCKTRSMQTNHTIWNIEHIRAIVTEIRQLGYDAILDEHEFCVKCGGKESKIIKRIRDIGEWESEYIETPNPSLIFKIRFSTKEEYHTAKSNIAADYNLVLEFLRGNDSCLGERDMTLPIHDNIDVIQKMLGLGKKIHFVRKKGRR